MKSTVISHYDSPKALRQSMVSEVLGPLQKGRNESSHHFIISKDGPTDHVVRQLRPFAKRRARIYNFERDRAKPWWTATIYVRACTNDVPLAEYDNGTTTMTINTDHHPILTKVFQSVLADHWPELTLKFVSDQGKPQYTWNKTKQPGPAPTTLDVSSGYYATGLLDRATNVLWRTSDDS